MHLGVTGKTIHPRRQPQSRPVGIFFPISPLRLPPSPGRSIDLPGRSVRQFFGHPPDLKFSHAEGLSDIGESRSSLIGAYSPHYCGMVRTIFFKDQIDYLIPAVMGKIEINIRQLL